MSVGALIIVILMFLFSIAACFLFGEILYFLNKTLNRIEDRKDKEQMLSTEISDDKLELLDKLIDIEFENYIKLHPDMFDVTGNSYIKESQFKNIIVDITNAVSLRLTDTILAQIQLTYKLDYHKIITLISKKVGLNLAIAAAEINNALLEDDTTIVEM